MVIPCLLSLPAQLDVTVLEQLEEFLHVFDLFQSDFDCCLGSVFLVLFDFGSIRLRTLERRTLNVAHLLVKVENILEDVVKGSGVNVDGFVFNHLFLF
jgi:hypothetical protein